MRVAIHQPNYLPWMGYFDKMAQVDKFVIFDDVQFPRGHHHCYETRSVVMGKNGPIELNVPVMHRGGELINQTRLAPGPWKRKHANTLRLNYPAGPMLSMVLGVYRVDWDMLCGFNVALIRLMAMLIGIKSSIVLSSELGVKGHGTEKILGIIKALGGDTYISGTGAGSKRYVSEEVFLNHGIKVLWHEYHGENISALDTIAKLEMACYG